MPKPLTNAPPAHRSGRPRLGVYRLQCMLPRFVEDELVRVEMESGGDNYRTRVAADALCEWAKQKLLSRSGGSLRQT